MTRTHRTSGRVASTAGVVRALLRRMSRLSLLVALSVAALPPRAGAQDSTLVPPNESRAVAGRVQKPGRTGDPVPVPGAWVVLHRVGPDHAGPLDSTHTNASGVYQFRYRTSGSAQAVYFVSTSYDGIAYFSSPLRTPDVRNGDADIIVFDTTSTGVHLKLEGRHIVLGAPGADGLRQVAEVFDLGNDSTKTLIARDTLSPLWVGHLPPGAESPTVSGGDVAPGAVTFAGSEVNLFAPVSPGVRQLAITYRLAAKSFPLVVPMEQATGVLEVLTEEPNAGVSGARITQVASVSAQGRAFKRYLAQDVPATAVLQVALPSSTIWSRQNVMLAIAGAMALLMLGALAVAMRRGRVGLVMAAPPEPESRRLIRALAALDAAFEQRTGATPEERAEHDRARSALKAQIAAALAAEGRTA